MCFHESIYAGKICGRVYRGVYWLQSHVPAVQVYECLSSRTSFFKECKMIYT